MTGGYAMPDTPCNIHCLRGDAPGPAPPGGRRPGVPPARPRVRPGRDGGERTRPLGAPHAGPGGRAAAPAGAGDLMGAAHGVPEADGVRIEYMPLSALVKAPRNPTRHRVDAIDASVRRFGFVSPLILDEATGRLVAGYGRLDALAAARAAGAPPPGRVRAEAGEWL